MVPSSGPLHMLTPIITFQLLLLQESWKDLFLLHLSQWAIPWDLGALFSSRQSQLQLSATSPLPDDKITDMEIKTMQVLFRYVAFGVNRSLQKRMGDVTGKQRQNLGQSF